MDGFYLNEIHMLRNYLENLRDLLVRLPPEQIAVNMSKLTNRTHAEYNHNPAQWLKLIARFTNYLKKDCRVGSVIIWDDSPLCITESKSIEPAKSRGRAPGVPQGSPVPVEKRKPAQKYSCETCIRGHRAASCKHKDRKLFAVRPKGRPTIQCTYCQERRKKGYHEKCTHRE